MSAPVALAILVVLLVGPVAFAIIERNLEAFIFALGVIAATAAAAWSPELVARAARAPVFITIAVIVAGVLFGRMRERLDQGFTHLRRSCSRPVLTATSLLMVGLLSSVITAIVAALMLVEVVGMLQLGPPARDRVTIAGCFAIGIGSALTPAGGPFSAIVADGLRLGFFDLIPLLGWWIVAGLASSSAIAAWFARGDYDLIAEERPVPEGIRDALIQGLKIFGFVAGLVLISAAYEPLAAEWVPRLTDLTLFWGNTLSAVLDNSTLAALEAHAIAPPRVRGPLLSMIVSGGMLIPGNIPNIICAGILGIGSREWARVGLPIGVLMLGIAFAVLWLAR